LEEIRLLAAEAAVVVLVLLALLPLVAVVVPWLGSEKIEDMLLMALATP
jgi:hypothetical protein